MRLLKRSRIASVTKRLRWHTNPSLSGLDRRVDGQRCSPGNDAPSCRLLPTNRLVTVRAIAVGVSLGIGKYRRVDFARNIGVGNGRVARPIEELCIPDKGLATVHRWQVAPSSAAPIRPPSQCLERGGVGPAHDPRGRAAPQTSSDLLAEVGSKPRSVGVQSPRASTRSCSSGSSHRAGGVDTAD